VAVRASQNVLNISFSAAELQQKVRIFLKYLSEEVCGLFHDDT
jgi:hypothetical protein